MNTKKETINSTHDNSKYKIELKNMTKTFLNGKIIANKDISLAVQNNEVHALVGENGAGKSTLMSILFGLYEQDSGEILIDGNKVKFESAKDAHKYKIGMVHQHFKLVDDYSIFKNIILGTEKILGVKFDDQDKFMNKLNEFIGVIETKNTREKILDLIKSYNLNLDIDKKVSKLTVGEQQKVEILKLLYLDAEILIFDEPTAVLSDNEILSFLEMIHHFKKQGKTIIIISHKLNELKQVADKGTVIRHGKVVGSFDPKTTPLSEVASMMVGRAIKVISNDLNEDFINNSPILEIKNLPLALLSNSSVKVPNSKWLSEFYKKIGLSSKINSFKKWWYEMLVKTKMIKFSEMKKPEELDFSVPSISFEIKAGEIFAIAGVQGNGQSELIEYISGLMQSPADTIFLNEKSISHLSIKKRYKLGMSFVPEDRHKHGLILDDSVSFNSVFNFLDAPIPGKDFSIFRKQFINFGFLNFSAINNHALKVINEFDVRGVGSLDDSVRGLSGGNQQKLIIGREIIKNNNFIIFAQPTRGLDVGAIEYIHSRIIQAKKEKKAVLLVSYELDEILNLADTIAVMNKNQIISVGSRKEMTRERIGMLMANQGEKEGVSHG